MPCALMLVWPVERDPATSCADMRTPGIGMPIVWIVRDGLGPGSVETTWPWSVLKFLVAWTGPALLLAAPLLALSFMNRRSAAPADVLSMTA